MTRWTLVLPLLFATQLAVAQDEATPDESAAPAPAESAPSEDAPPPPSDGEANADGESPPPAPPPPPPPAPTAPKADDMTFQLEVWKVVSTAVPAIDACTERYTSEFPDRRGSVPLHLKVSDEGRVVAAKATSPLQSSDRLNECLASAGRYLRFPRGPFEITLPVQVAKGVKARFNKPGEKPAAPPAAQAAQGGEPEGFIRFLPSWE